MMRKIQKNMRKIAKISCILVCVLLLSVFSSGTVHATESTTVTSAPGIADGTGLSIEYDSEATTLSVR